MAELARVGWNVELLALGLAGTLGLGVAARRSGGRVLLLCLALGCLLLAVATPLEALGSGYLLSAHMLQHLLLAQVVPPLLLLGLPPDAVERALRRRTPAALERAARTPALAWVVGMAALWLWHVPLLYELSAQQPVLRSIQHVTVLLAGLVFWWPIAAPAAQSRLEALPATLYLAAACFASSVLGIVLTFAPAVVYPTYLSPADPLGIRALCTRYGLTPLVDQQLGGLLMWAPCCLLYLSAVAFVLVRWYGAPELDAAYRPRRSDERIEA